MHDDETRQPIPWIKWDFAQWLGGKVSRRPAIEQAVFINLQALMMREGGPCRMGDADKLDMADRLHATPEQIGQAVNNLAARGIVVVDGDSINIKFLSEQFAEVNETRAKRVKAGAKGGRAKAKQILASATIIVASAKQNLAEKRREGEENKNEDINTCVANAPPLPKHEKSRTSKSIPPTLQEVTEYCDQRAALGKRRIDPDRFCSFYESKGWIVGKSKMKDWQAAVRNWEASTHNATTSSSGQILRDQKRQEWTDEDLL